MDVDVDEDVDVDVEEVVDEDVGGREEAGLSHRWNVCHEERMTWPWRYSLSSARRNVADPMAAQMGRMFFDRDVARWRMRKRISIRS